MVGPPAPLKGMLTLTQDSRTIGVLPRKEGLHRSEDAIGYAIRSFV
jgi:hypothetical protein